MFKLLYNIGIKLYSLAVKLAAFKSKKAKLWLSGRETQKAQMASWAGKFSGKHTVWFQCASLGEFEQARPLIEAYLNKYKDAELLLSFFSPSGYEIRKAYLRAKLVCYLPQDTPENAAEWISLFKPKRAFFTKNEFWWNYIEACAAHKIPVYSICCDFSSSKWQNPLRKLLYKKIWQNFRHFFVMNTATATYLQAFQHHKVGTFSYTLVGDTRFDRVLQNFKASAPIPFISDFKGTSPLFIFGSFWEKDFKVLMPFIQHLLSVNWKVCIAPHEINHEQLKKWLHALNIPNATYHSHNQAPIADTVVYFLDTIGQLASAYNYADAAYVGGGFTGSLHNILEPTVFGIPTFSGPRINSFPEAVSLASKQLFFPVKDAQDCIQQFDRLINNPSALHQIKMGLAQEFEVHSGATAKIMNYFEALGE
jgi:3-deoxy-D-manno-octulosonic-acid transferase